MERRRFGQRLVHLCVIAELVLGFLPEGSARAQGIVSAGQPMHSSAKKTLWDRKVNRVVLIGDAVVRQEKETITADEITLDHANRVIHAKGNCTYVTTGSVITGDEIRFNMDSRVGVIHRGRVSTDRFTLTGETLQKLGEGHFRTEQGSYTTCIDCPHAWTLLGDEVDLQFGGYAYLKGVSARIKDAPILWFPYLIVPLKTERQTGLLPTRFGFLNEGLFFVQPFFWATSRSVDFTLALGDYTGRGFRGELEGRYALTSRSGGRFSLFSLTDRSFGTLLESRGLSGSNARWAFDLEQTQELPLGIDQKARFIEVSDSLYPAQIGDVRGVSEGTIASEVSLSRASSTISSFVSFRRYRNLIALNSDPRVFDRATVQVLPQAFLSTNDQFISGTRYAGGLALGVTRFTRDEGPFDTNGLEPGATETPRLGIDPLRKATRFTATPSLYTSFRPWDLFSVSPVAEYRSFFYDFEQAAPALFRGYLLLQVDAAARLEKIFEMEDPEVPRMKHLIRPSLTYSLIPLVQEDAAHPFIQQIRYAQEQGFSGFNFDNSDLVPRETSRTYNNYFLPLGHSVSLGFSSQWIRRRGSVQSNSPAYQPFAEVRAAETINLLEFSRAESDRQPFSRFSLSGSLNFDRWNASFDYGYFPYAEIDSTRGRHTLSLGGAYVIERGTRHGILSFDRSLDFGYTYNRVGSGQTHNPRFGIRYSLNDYFLPSMNVSYDLIQSRFLSVAGALQWQSQSRCYQFNISGSRYVCDNVTTGGYCDRIGLELTVNLTGGGFGAVTDFASQVINR